MKRLADVQLRHVQLDALRDVPGQHLDLDGAQHLVQDAALIAHAFGRAHHMDRDLETDLLVRADFLEVHMQKRGDTGAERVPLDLADQRARRAPVHGQLDQRAFRLDSLEQALQLGAAHRERLRRAAVAVDNGGHLTRTAQRASGALAKAAAGLGGELND